MLVPISTYYLCTVVDCDVLDSIENGYIEYSDGTIYLSEATYNCHNGHNLTLSGDVMRTCQGNGLWNGNVPTCNSEYTCCTGILWLYNAIQNICVTQQNVFVDSHTMSWPSKHP